jgi:hypothetical protein
VDVGDTPKGVRDALGMVSVGEIEEGEAHTTHQSGQHKGTRCPREIESETETHEVGVARERYIRETKGMHHLIELKRV